jgi:tRNA(Ile)-lysidine synthase
MSERFLENIKIKKLFEPNQKILLAVSGGIDSMVMLYLFEKSGFDYGIVHCNFQLRGDESDQDEEFVKKQVLIHGVSSFFKRFDTEEYAQINGISIEMAARDLRYEYFEKIRIEHHYDFIATAHHSDDLIETFFLNLSRKTGIKGLTGIKDKSGKIIRPLLFASRDEIEKFASENYIEFREDSTNSEVFYQRNFLRHRILPLFSELNPSFKKNILASIENLKDAETVYSGFFEIEKQKVLENATDSQIIDIEKLRKSEHPKILLLEILTAFNFNPSVTEEVFQSLEGEPGKQFYSKTHRLVKDREKLFVSEITERRIVFFTSKPEILNFSPLSELILKNCPAKISKSEKKKIWLVWISKNLNFLTYQKMAAGRLFSTSGNDRFQKSERFFD